MIVAALAGGLAVAAVVVVTASDSSETATTSEVRPTDELDDASASPVAPTGGVPVQVTDAPPIDPRSAVPEAESDIEDPDPEPGSVPDGLVPLDVEAPPTGDGTFDVVQSPFTRVDPPGVAAGPPVASTTFVPVDLDTGPGIETGSDPGSFDLVAATGCAHRCIAGATVAAVDGSVLRYDVRVELDGPALVEIYLSQAPIERTADGRPVRPFSTPTASGDGEMAWATTVVLETDTEYHALVRATDDQGTSVAVGSFTTLAARGPDQFATPRPCDDGCLVDLSVDAADDGTAIDIGFTSSADTTVSLAFSRDQFTQTDDGPTLPDATTTTVDVEAGGRTTLQLPNLTPNTAYSVSVTATDALGGTDTWVARLATPSPTIVVGIDRIHISGDGDEGRANRGEITFRFGTAVDYWGERGEQKIASNTTVRPGRAGSMPVDADGSGVYPGVYAFAGERDGTALLTCFVAADPTGDWRPDTVGWCRNARTTWSVARTLSMTLAEIEALPTCAAFGVDNPDADRCAWVHTAPNSPDQVSFDMVVTFDLDPAGG